jgi:hypothetical protein
MFLSASSAAPLPLFFPLTNCRFYSSRSPTTTTVPHFPSLSSRILLEHFEHCEHFGQHSLLWGEWCLSSLFGGYQKE